MCNSALRKTVVVVYGPYYFEIGNGKEMVPYLPVRTMLDAPPERQTHILASCGTPAAMASSAWKYPYRFARRGQSTVAAGWSLGQLAGSWPGAWAYAACVGQHFNCSFFGLASGDSCGFQDWFIRLHALGRIALSWWV